MNTIIMNSQNFDSTSNNRFIYNFPSNIKMEAGTTIGVESVSVYNSIFNVEASRGNNTFSIIWNADTAVTYNFTIPDGFYSISDLNYYLQYECVQNDLYCVNSSGNYVYFVELVVNSTVYGSELRCYPLPDTTEAGTLSYTKPSGASWSFHASLDQTPQVVIPTAAFGSLFGFIAGTFPASVESTSQFIGNTITPQISVVNSLILTCNLINNELSNPVNVFFSMPLNASYGSLMTSSAATRMDSYVYEGMYNRIVIEFLDQQYERINLHDTEVLIKLVLIKPQLRRLNNIQ